MNKNIIKCFNLQGYLIDKIDTGEKEVLLRIRSPRVWAICPCCSSTTRKIHQYHLRRIKHGWFQAKQIVLLVRKRRFYCKKCNRPFSEYLPGIDRKRHSRSFQIASLEELRLASFSSIASKLKTSTNTLIRFLNDITDQRNIFWPKQGEIILGIDEHSYAGRDLVITITELKRHQLLTVLKDDRKRTLKDFLEQIPKEVKSRIKEVCIDMNAGYRKAIEETLPGVIITNDKFHVLREAQSVLEETRLVIQSLGDRRYQRIPKLLLQKSNRRLSLREKQKLKQIFDRYKSFPCLKEAYLIKERVRDVYESQDRTAAERKLNSIILMLEGERVGLLKQLRRTLKRWQPCILNYFTNYTTNAFTEGVHTKIKLIKRISFGFSNINNYIAKITLAFLPLIWLINNSIYHTL